MAAFATAALACAAVPSTAPAAPVTSGSLDWTHFNHRAPFGPPPANCPAGKTCTRTYLGYTTGIGATPVPTDGTSNGATPAAPATGPTVTPTSPFGTNPLVPVPYAWAFPTPTSGTIGTFDAATKAADVEFRGTLTFRAHGDVSFTFIDPKIVLNGGTADGTDGQIFASGTRPGTQDNSIPAGPYTRSEYVHDLDLRSATINTAGDVTTISGMIPDLNLPEFTGLAGFGQGSDRVPNAQGSFSVTLTAAGGEPPPTAQCADGLDNDSDGLIDTADSDCTGPTDTTEGPAAPPPTGGASQTQPVTGTVGNALSLTLGSPSTSLGTFLPGVAASYDGSLTATVLATGDAKLTVQDPTTPAADAGFLVNGTSKLASALQAQASKTATPGTYAAISASPLTLLTFPGGASNVPVTIGLRQAISASEPLLTGTYSKTLTFTVSSGIA